MPSGALQTNSDNPSVFMIIDLIEAVGGSLCESSGLSAQFETASQAVSAAKHIQRAAQEFTARSASQKLGTAILVSDVKPNPVPDQEIRQTLEQAQPGQIFVTTPIRQALSDSPAWKFRPVSPSPTAEDRAFLGTEELIWADPATYERYAELLGSSGETWSVISEPIAPASAPPHEESTSYDPTQIRIAGDSVESEGMFEGLPQTSRSKTPYLVAGAVILSAIVGGFALLRYSQPHQSNASTTTERPSAPPTNVQKTPSSSAPVSAKLPVSDAEETVTQTKKAEAVEKTSPPPAQAQPQMANVTPAPKPGESVPRPALAKPPEDSGGLYHMTPAERSETAKAATGISPSQINRILAMADEQTGDGKFAEARKKYLIVLYLEPRNAAASKGLQRLLKRQREAER